MHTTGGERPAAPRLALMLLPVAAASIDSQSREQGPDTRAMNRPLESTTPALAVDGVGGRKRIAGMEFVTLSDRKQTHKVHESEAERSLTAPPDSRQTGAIDTRPRKGQARNHRTASPNRAIQREIIAPKAQIGPSPSQPPPGSPPEPAPLRGRASAATAPHAP